MKKYILVSMFIFLITIVLNNAARTLTTRGDRAHISFLRDCDKGSVRVEKYSLINLPTSIEIQGRNCAGPDSAYQGYRAEIWDHFFWLLS